MKLINSSGVVSILTAAALEPGIFGDGSDNDAVFDGVAHPSGSSGTSPYLLTRSVFYRNMTVASGKTLNTSGFRIFCTGRLDVSGTVACDSPTSGSAGTAGVSGSGGVGAPSGDLGGGTNGGPGGTAGTGAAGAGQSGGAVITGASDATRSLGGAGGAGSGGGAGSSGVAEGALGLEPGTPVEAGVEVEAERAR